MAPHLSPDHDDEATVRLSNHSRPRKGRKSFCSLENEEQEEKILKGSAHSQPERLRRSLSGDRRRRGRRCSSASATRSSSPSMLLRRSATQSISPRSKGSLYVLPKKEVRKVAPMSLDLLAWDTTSSKEDQGKEMKLQDSDYERDEYSIPLSGGNDGGSSASRTSGRSRSLTRRGRKKSPIVEKVPAVRRWSADDFQPLVNEIPRSLSRERKRNTRSNILKMSNSNNNINNSRVDLRPLSPVRTVETVGSKNARWEVAGAGRDQDIFTSGCQQPLFIPMRKSSLVGSL